MSIVSSLMSSSMNTYSQPLEKIIASKPLILQDPSKTQNTVPPSTSTTTSTNVSTDVTDLTSYFTNMDSTTMYLIAGAVVLGLIALKS